MFPIALMNLGCVVKLLIYFEVFGGPRGEEGKYGSSQPEKMSAIKSSRHGF